MLFLLALTVSAGEAPVVVPPITFKGDLRREASAPRTVIPRAQLDAAPDLPGALAGLPGVELTRLGGLGDYSTLSVRGSSPEQVLVLLDGMPLNGADGAPVDLGALPLGPLEDVALWRGSAPLDAGASAIGGTLGLTTRAPTRGLHADFTAGGGSFGTRLGRAYVGAGGPRASGALSLDYLGSANDFTFTTDRGTLLDDGDDAELERANAAFDRLSVLLRGAARVGAGLSVRVTSLTQLDDRGLPGNGLFTTVEAHRREVKQLTGLALLSRLGDYELRVEPWASFVRVELSDPLGELGFLVPARTRDRLWAVGGRLAASASYQWESVAVVPKLVVDVRHDEFVPADRGLSGVPSGRDSLVAGGELGVRWAFGGGWALNVSANGRAEVSWNELTGRGAQPGEAVHHSDDVLTEGSARLAARATLGGLELHGALARNVRFPSLFDLFGNTGVVLGNPDLAPETSLGGEIGARLQLWADPSSEVRGADESGERGEQATPGELRVTLDTAFHLTSTRQLILLVGNGQGVARAENVDDAWLYGGELGVSVDWSWLSWRGAFTWLEARQVSEQPSRDGKTLPGRARFSGHTRLGGRWALPGVVLDAWTELEALGPNPLDYANTSVTNARLWWAVGLGGELLGGRLRLRADVRNLLGDTTQDVIGYPLPGITAMGTVGWVQ